MTAPDRPYPEELAALLRAIRDHQDATRRWEAASDALDAAHGRSLT